MIATVNTCARACAKRLDTMRDGGSAPDRHGSKPVGRQRGPEGAA